MVDPTKWLKLYGDLLFQYTLSRVNDREMAEDMVQETFLSALKGLAGFKEEASEKNWLFAILKNKIIDPFCSFNKLHFYFRKFFCNIRIEQNNFSNPSASLGANGIALNLNQQIGDNPLLCMDCSVA